MTWRRSRLFFGATALLLSGLALWAFWWEPGRLVSQHQTLALPGWPEGCNGLRIAVLADLHTGSPHNGLAELGEIVERIADASPDLVLLAGDYVIHGVLGGRFVEPEVVAAGLGELRAPMGVYAVLGNHDWWFDGPRVRAALEEVGIPVLENSAVRVGAGECGFWLAGVGDFWEGAPDIAAALSAVSAGAPAVVFTHNPDIFPEIPAAVRLTIAGHTHGGQVYLPGLGRLVVPSKFGERYAIGHVVEGGRHLFVSSGVGTSILPVRFLVPPEISVLTVTAAPPGVKARR